MDIQGKVALITGGARIGAAVAEELARRGVSVGLVYRKSRAQAEATAERIRTERGTAEIFQGDVSDPQAIPLLVELAAQKLGHIDILINMASLYESRQFDSLDTQAWDTAMNTDARGSYLMALAAVPHMRRQGAGRIINFSDWLAVSGRPRYQGYLPYYTAKMAVLGLTQALALELAPEILVNCIAPGPILPPEDMSAEERQASIRSTPLARWGGPGEIVKAVLSLIETDFVTGECIRVDGGRHLK